MQVIECGLDFVQIQLKTTSLIIINLVEMQKETKSDFRNWKNKYLLAKVHFSLGRR